MQKVAIITGASRGIGKACAEFLARHEIKVIANYNNSEAEAKALKEELKRCGIEIDIFKADVSKREEVKKLIEFVKMKYGKIDILINNAGISQTKLFTDITDEEWQNMINTNLTSVFYMTQEILPYMIDKKEGCIINISSVWGTNGGACEVHYSASKAGIIGMTKALAKELGPSNIRVNAIAPGAIDTDMNKGYSKEEINELEKEIPLGRMGNPEGIAKCVYWFIEENYITGQVIKIDRTAGLFKK